MKTITLKQILEKTDKEYQSDLLTYEEIKRLGVKTNPPVSKRLICLN